MLRLQINKMTTFEQITANFNFLRTFQVAYQTKQLLLRMFFDPVLSLQSDQIIAFC